MYSNLTTAAPHITPSQIADFFKDATFGVPAGARRHEREPGARGDDRARQGVRRPAHLRRHARGADVRDRLRHRRGPAVLHRRAAPRRRGRPGAVRRRGQREHGREVWASEPYTQQDLANQVQYGLAHSTDGPQILSDATNYVAGINAYIAKAQNPLFTGTMMPAEYLALGMSGPQPFTVEDLVTIATLVGGIFGNGGGEQLSNAVLYQDLKQKFGKERRLMAGSPEPKPKAGWVSAKSKDTSGFGTFLSFDDPSDPEAPTTVHGKSFPYQTLPRPASGRARGSPCPTRARSSTPTTSSAGRSPPGSRTDPVRREARVRATPLRAVGPRAGRRDPRPSRRPWGRDLRRPDRRQAQHVQRAADQRQAQRQRPPAGRDGPAGVLLRARDPDGGGHPRARNRRRRRRLPGRQPVRRARPRPRLRVVGDLGRPEHRRHLRGAALQPQRRTGQHVV